MLRVPADATLHEYRDAAIIDGDDLASDDAGDSSEKLVAIEERVAALQIENLIGAGIWARWPQVIRGIW